jgi:hypothetical protein
VRALDDLQFQYARSGELIGNADGRFCGSIFRAMLDCLR